MRVALAAGPGVGKTTLAMAFTAWMKDRGWNWHYVHEYARDFIDTYGAESIEDASPLIQMVFMDKQISLQEKIPDVVDGFITDSPVFLSWVYGALNSEVSEDVETYIALKNCYKGFIRSLTEYDIIALVRREKDYVQDGTRMQTEDEAKDLDHLIRTLLTLHNVPFIEVSGTTEERCRRLEAAVKELTEEKGKEHEQQSFQDRPEECHGRTNT